MELESRTRDVIDSTGQTRYKTSIHPIYPQSINQSRIAKSKSIHPSVHSYTPKHQTHPPFLTLPFSYSVPLSLSSSFSSPLFPLTFLFFFFYPPSILYRIAPHRSPVQPSPAHKSSHPPASNAPVRNLYPIPTSTLPYPTLPNPILYLYLYLYLDSTRLDSTAVRYATVAHGILMHSP